MNLEAAMEIGSVGQSLARLKELETARTRKGDKLSPRPLTITTPGYGEPINIPGSLAAPVMKVIMKRLSNDLEALTKKLAKDVK